MSPERQPRVSVRDEDAIAIRSLALKLPGGTKLAAHAHPWGQMIYATEGVMTVSTPAGSWVVPSHRAVWVPAEIVHDVATTNRVTMRTLYLRPDLARDLPSCCRVLAVSPLLRELVLATIAVGMLREDEPAQARLAAVVVDQIHATRDVPLQLPWPVDPRARRVAERVQACLDDASTLADVADGSGGSGRTLERLFVRETGLTFGAWRQRARLLEALRLLAGGESVTATAVAVGFASTSAFVTMFRRALGETPGRYFRTSRAADDAQR
jgi:AraC-like DNA-binding protein